jgi:hypothetical protein
MEARNILLATRSLNIPVGGRGGSGFTNAHHPYVGLGASSENL